MKKKKQLKRQLNSFLDQLAESMGRQSIAGKRNKRATLKALKLKLR